MITSFTVLSLFWFNNSVKVINWTLGYYVLARINQLAKLTKIYQCTIKVALKILRDDAYKYWKFPNHKSSLSFIRIWTFSFYYGWLLYLPTSYPQPISDLQKKLPFLLQVEEVAIICGYLKYWKNWIFVATISFFSRVRLYQKQIHVF